MVIINIYVYVHNNNKIKQNPTQIFAGDSRTASLSIGCGGSAVLAGGQQRGGVGDEEGFEAHLNIRIQSVVVCVRAKVDIVELCSVRFSVYFVYCCSFSHRFSNNNVVIWSCYLTSCNQCNRPGPVRKVQIPER